MLYLQSLVVVASFLVDVYVVVTSATAVGARDNDGMNTGSENVSGIEIINTTLQSNNTTDSRPERNSARSFLMHTNNHKRCKDAYSDCASLGKFYCGKAYVTWAFKNCRNMCGWCDVDPDSIFSLTSVDPDSFYSQTALFSTTILPTTSPVCEYKGQYYRQGDVWQDGCQYNCTCEDESVGYYRCRNLCPDYVNLPPDCRLTAAHGQCCPKLLCTFPTWDPTPTPQHFGCTYKGHRYVQSQTWQDGCRQSCKCVDGARGFYSCRAVCLNWDNLPNMCHKDPAPNNLCCEQIRCPEQVIVNVPLAYKSQYPSTSAYNYSYV